MLSSVVFTIFMVQAELYHIDLGFILSVVHVQVHKFKAKAKRNKFLFMLMI